MIVAHLTKRGSNLQVTNARDAKRMITEELEGTTVIMSDQVRS